MELLAGLFALALPMVGVVTGVIMIIGAVKMMRLRSYSWAMTASVAALLPCTPAWLLGLIMGIWSLVVLSRPEVKAAFAAQAAGAQRVAPSGARPQGGSWLGCLVAAILVLLAVPAGLLGLLLLYKLAALPRPPAAPAPVPQAAEAWEAAVPAPSEKFPNVILAPEKPPDQSRNETAGKPAR